MTRANGYDLKVTGYGGDGGVRDGMGRGGGDGERYAMYVQSILMS